MVAARPTRVLVVARPSPGRALAEILAVAGHEVYRTPDAANLLAIARRLRPDAVLVALDLPWFAGSDAVEALNELDSCLRIVLLSDAPCPRGCSELVVLPIRVDRCRLLETVAKARTDFQPRCRRSACAVA
jgi:hypothetical protein